MTWNSLHLTQPKPSANNEFCRRNRTKKKTTKRSSVSRWFEAIKIDNTSRVSPPPPPPLPHFCYCYYYRLHYYVSCNRHRHIRRQCATKTTRCRCTPHQLILSRSKWTHAFVSVRKTRNSISLHLKNKILFQLHLWQSLSCSLSCHCCFAAIIIIIMRTIRASVISFQGIEIVSALGHMSFHKQNYKINSNDIRLVTPCIVLAPVRCVLIHLFDGHWAIVLFLGILFFFVFFIAGSSL